MPKVRFFLYNYIKDKKYKNILDIGCGDATLFDGLQKHQIDIEYTGVDSCDYFCNIVSKKTNVIKSDITNMDLKDSEYDIVFGRHILEHQPSFMPTLDEVIRVSKYQAILIFYKTYD